MVLKDELPLIRRAFASLGDGSYNPKVTFVVVQKRHHTRLFVSDDRDADRSGNVPAGTCVDGIITHPHEFSFFLVSHAGIQGTSRPAHYHVLLDENGFGADAMQKLCFDLCHNYCRCTRSVSIVPPVYYSHLAAYRGRVLRSAAEGSDTRSISSGSSGVYDLNVHKRLEGQMYFV